MDGQDILSAALDECGLGDFFSSNPVTPENLSDSTPYVDQSTSDDQYSPQPIDPEVINEHNQDIDNNNSDQHETSPLPTFNQQQSLHVPISSFVINNNNIKNNSLNSASEQTSQPLQIKKFKKIIIKKIAPDGKQTMQNVIIANNNNINSTSNNLNGRTNILTLKTVNGTNSNITLNPAIKKIVTLKSCNTISASNGTINTSVSHPINEKPNSTQLISNNVIIKNSPSAGVPATKTLINPNNVNPVVNSNNTKVARIVLANANTSNNASQMVHFANGKVFKLNGSTVMTTDANSNVNGNRVITIKTIRAPLTMGSSIQQSPIFSTPTPQISSPVITSSAPPMNPVSMLNQPRLQMPSISAPTISQKPRVISKPIVRVHSKSKSLIGNPNSSSLGNGRRIKANKSNPSSPNSGQITPESLIKLQEDQADRDIMLEEVKRMFEEQDEDEFANLETFADYMPAKLRIGSRHPDKIVETASLSSIPPPDVYYRLAIPDEVIDEGRLSALQLESIIYASQQHENILADGCRAGFLIGDGAGVGKGRTVAGIIYENYLHGRKRSLWFSVSTDLKYDAERDLYDIGASKIEVHILNKFKYGYKIHSPENDNVKRGVIFSTYNSLIGESSSISGKYSSRFNQIVQWCGEDFDGVIIFDECHKAKNLFPSGTTRATKTGQAVLELQRKLPKARVVYASATGATEPKNMGYMTRLGIWGSGTPFEDFQNFVNTVEKRGVGAMELVAIDLKMRGTYVARQLSFKGVSFRIEYVPLSREFIRIYNCCCRLWVSAKTKFEKALDLMGAETQVSKAVWTQFWAAHQRFFKYLCIASKVRFAVAFVNEALRSDKSIVIGLQSTGEARTIEALDDCGGELNDFVSTAKAVFQSLIEKHFPAPNRKKLAKLLGNDTSFFDQLGIKLSRNAHDEIVVSSFENEDEQTNLRMKKAQNFFNAENDSDDDDDFVSVSEGEVSDKNGDDSSDIDSDDLDNIDDIMDQKLGLKRKKGAVSANSNALRFMDILLGPPTAGSKKRKAKKRLKVQAKKPKISQTKKSMKSKYEKFYDRFDNVGEDVGGYCEKLRDELMQQLESFGERLPPNTLDELIDELGGPENVAEMTGRKGRVVSTEGGVQYEARTENDVSLEMLNLVEKQRFMDDDKRVAIISEAASSGISLHADRRAKNQCRRVHITLELPWSADRAIQQFGRTHRSNQVTAPEYVFLISNLAGEKRFASIVAKRLESLGALTHGDRRATESRDLSQFNIDTKYGRQALELVMKTIVGNNEVKPLVPLPESYPGDFLEDCKEGLNGVGIVNIDRRTRIAVLDKDYCNINKFLNRLLGLEVELQNTLFQYFQDTLEAVIKKAKKSGKYDSGIIDLSSEVGNVQKLNEENFIMKSSNGATKIQLHTVSIDRGLSYEKAYNMYQQAITEDDYFKNEIGFYISTSTFQIRKSIWLAIPESPSKNQDVKQIFRIYKPSLGLQSKYETKSTLREKGQKLDNLEEAEKLWREHFDNSETQCTHMVLFGRCRLANRNQQHNELYPPSVRQTLCDFGLRKRTYCILSGSVLTVWPEIEKKIPYIQTEKLQIARLRTSDGLKYIGPMVPEFYVNEVRTALQNLASEKK